LSVAHYFVGAERFAPQPSSIYVAEKINEADANA